MNEIETCANLTCEEKCCSHEQDRSSGLIEQPDHCCSYHEYETHMQITDHLDLTHEYKYESSAPESYELNNNVPYQPYQPYQPEPENPSKEITHRVHILTNPRWHHFSTIGIVLVTSIVFVLLLLTTYYALRWRRKYARIKNSQIMVRHAVIDDHVTMRNFPRIVMTNQPNEIPSSSSQNNQAQEKSNSTENQTKETSSTPPSYTDIY